MTRDEKREPALLPNDSRIFRMDKIVDSVSDPDRQFDVRVNGEDLRPGSAFSWRGDRTEMHRLTVADRVAKTTTGVGYKFFLNDYPLVEMGNYWSDTSGKIVDMAYVVQSNTKLAERCMLMTTDHGPRRPRP